MSRDLLIIFWVRRDFRLLDNPALTAAIEVSKQSNIPFLPIFVLDDALLLSDEFNIGYPRRLVLSRILSEYATQFPAFQILAGETGVIFETLSRLFQVQVFANDDIEPYARSRDARIQVIIEANQGQLSLHRDQMTVDSAVTTKNGNIYSVFSPFRNASLASFLDTVALPQPKLDKVRFFDTVWPAEFNRFTLAQVAGLATIQNLPAPELQAIIFKLIDRPWQLTFGHHRTVAADKQPQDKTETLDLDNILERPKFEEWYFNEVEALRRFQTFNQHQILNYKNGRDFLSLDVPGLGQTSRMSLALKWGLASPRTLKHMILEQHGSVQGNDSLFQYVSELMWREFYKYILYHYPDVLETEFQARFRGRIDWVDQEQGITRFKAWINGETGYRLVDACMHQISHIGWMHNRGRMLTASILTKNLGVDWRWGQDYFRAVLVDMDEASNNGGWQWASSVGADPKPIRIFNPYLQAEKYDADGVYQRQWLPVDYSLTEPILEHTQARAEAMRRYGLQGSGEAKAARDF